YKYNTNKVFQSASKAEDVFWVLLVLKLVLQLGSSVSLLINLDIQKNHYLIDFTNRKGVKQDQEHLVQSKGFVNECLSKHIEDFAKTVKYLCLGNSTKLPANVVITMDEVTRYIKRELEDGKGILGIGKERGRRKNVKNKWELNKEDDSSIVAKIHDIKHQMLEDITREGYSIYTCIADLIVNGTWNWPLSWLAKAPNLGLVPAPTLIASRQDCMKWHDTNGTMADFTVKCVWEALRP
ncbi:hypothetical protein Tco_1119160, partial [Tanacetum coccineum]